MTDNDPVLNLIDAELDRLAVDMNAQPYPFDVKWWMWRKKQWNDGVNIAHEVSIRQLREIRNAYVNDEELAKHVEMEEAVDWLADVDLDDDDG